MQNYRKSDYAINKNSPNIVYRFHTHILLENVPGLAPTSLLLLEQLRTIDRKRLRGYIGRISKEKMLEVDAALAISIGIGYPNERRTHNV